MSFGSTTKVAQQATMRHETDEYFTHTALNDGTYRIAAKNKDNLPETITIPATYKGIPITQIAVNGFNNCDTIKTVIISNRISSISSQSFSRCDFNMLKFQIV